MFELSPHIDKNKIFLVNLSEIEGRLDPFYYSHPFIKIKKQLIKKQFVKFRELIKSLTNGYDFRNYSKSGTPYIKVANVKMGVFDFSKLQYINFNSSEISKNIQLKKGNLLLTRKGTFGIALALDKDYDYVISSEIFYIEIDNDKINSKFLEIFFNSNIGQLQFDQNKIGAIMGSLSQEAINKLIIPLPPKEIQQQIINLYETAYKTKQQKETEAESLLNSIDDYLLGELGITLPEKDNSLENRMFKVNFSEVTGGRFDPYYYQSHFRLFFEKLNRSIYPIYSIKELSKIITSGITPLSGGEAYTIDKKNGIPFIRSGNIDINGNINFDDLLYLKEEIHKTLMRSSQVKYNDLLVAIVGATIGQVGIYKDEREANINQAIALIRLKDGNNVDFIKEVLKSSIGQYNLNRLKRPVARANINLEEISTIQLPIPPIEKQNEIAEHIKEIREQAKQLKSKAKEVLEQAKQEVEKMILGE